MLEIWFDRVLEKLLVSEQQQVEIITDDQDHTLEYFKNGFVSSCISTSDTAIPGCHCQYIGNFDYVLVATPAFQQKYFNNSDSNQACLLQAPALKFDQKDDLHAVYLQQHFNIRQQPRYNVMPSVKGFKQLTLLSHAYALIPRIDISAELESGQLVELFPDKPMAMRLYFHYWGIKADSYQSFAETVIEQSRDLLAL